MGTVGRYVAVWPAMFGIAFLNGAARELGYRHAMGDLAAHQVSTATGIVALGLFIWFLTGRWRLSSAGQALTIGVVWLVITAAFEFLFGHYVMGHPWQRLFGDYSLFEGRLWVLVLVWIAIAPLLFYRLRGAKRV